jgi:hypothetical protein
VFFLMPLQRGGPQKSFVLLAYEDGQPETKGRSGVSDGEKDKGEAKSYWESKG